MDLQQEHKHNLAIVLLFAHMSRVSGEIENYVHNQGRQHNTGGTVLEYLKLAVRKLQKDKRAEKRGDPCKKLEVQDYFRLFFVFRFQGEDGQDPYSQDQCEQGYNESHSPSHIDKLALFVLLLNLWILQLEAEHALENVRLVHCLN